MSNQNTQFITISTSDPSAIGLFGLAIVTLVASTQKLGITDGVSLVLPWAIFLGGFAQLFACIHDAKHSNTFGTTAFGAFALFWLGVGASWLIQLGVFGEKLAQAADPKQLGFVFIGYLIFSLFMTIGAMETHKVLFIIFILIDCLFIGLSLTSFEIYPEASHRFAGISEILIAVFSFYGSAAAVLNTHFGGVFLPIGKPFGIFKK